MTQFWAMNRERDFRVASPGRLPLRRFGEMREHGRCSPRQLRNVQTHMKSYLRPSSPLRTMPPMLGHCDVSL